MNKTIALFFALLFSQAAAATQVVEGFLADPVEILDSLGKHAGEMARKDAPKGPLPVLQYNESLDLVQVELAGKPVWLDTEDLRMNPTKVVKLACKEVPIGKGEGKENPSSLGYGGCE
ncbi:hypothetical protein PMM47T1_21673 [Pseudomonas sp. M47T1]|uniref:hypothetical protein n=1 Tax=unclassified Pseudomonas TaxID=196821 RepID=UPI0002606FFB|nr:hypothetical protein [Pseudomonas sp. M47T1]EIK94544.1 hypothetical protein PMM47T1_21673 [Pseudomonas sp. M47T1]